MTESNVRRLWYLRKNEKIIGPFPGAVLSQFLLLGRLSDTDEVSLDQAVWEKLADVSELVPEEMKADLSDPVNQARLEAARRRADERGAEFPGNNQDFKDRRSEDSGGLRSIRRGRVSERLDAEENRSRKQNLILVLFLLAICGGLLALFKMYTPKATSNEIDCDAPAAPGVNWSNCNLQGIVLDGVSLAKAQIRNANMSNASLYRTDLSQVDLAFTNLGMANLRLTDLQRAILVGANLRGADLRGADLRGADLSYANLEGVRMTEAQLDGALFDKTIWVNGMLCEPGSIGECRITGP